MKGLPDKYDLAQCERFLREVGASPSPVLPIAEACRSDGELFDTELILRAERAGLGVEELPVTVTERRRPRTSITRRALRTIVGLARLRITLARHQ